MLPTTSTRFVRKSVNIIQTHTETFAHALRHRQWHVCSCLEDPDTWTMFHYRCSDTRKRIDECSFFKLLGLVGSSQLNVSNLVCDNVQLKQSTDTNHLFCSTRHEHLFQNEEEKKWIAITTRNGNHDDAKNGTKSGKWHRHKRRWKSMENI